MAKGLTNGFSEKQLAIYISQYYERADLVFRFGALLSLSREGAEHLTEQTFRLLIEDFSQVKSNTSPEVLLMALAWKAWSKIKNDKFREWSVPILQSMKSIGVEQRAALFAVDIAGLEISDSAKIFNTTDAVIRQMLATGHKHLATATISV